jgi:hypothetical protein
MRFILPDKIKLICMKRQAIIVGIIINPMIINRPTTISARGMM